MSKEELPSNAIAKLQGDIDSLLQDLRRSLNSSWYAYLALTKQADSRLSEIDTKGSNFTAAASLLCGIEFVARLATGLKDVHAVKEFIDDYFSRQYTESGVLLWELFRHGHVHNYTPQVLHFSPPTIVGQVGWIEPPQRIEDIERAVREDSVRVSSEVKHMHFWPTENSNVYFFRFYPQIAYADTVLAVEQWREHLKMDQSAIEKFRNGIFRGIKHSPLKEWKVDPIKRFLAKHQIIQLEEPTYTPGV